MPHGANDRPEPHALGLAFLAAFWVVSALAFFPRLERFSTAFASVVMLALGVGLGLLLSVLRPALARRD